MVHADTFSAHLIYYVVKQVITCHQIDYNSWLHWNCFYLGFLMNKKQMNIIHSKPIVNNSEQCPSKANQQGLIKYLFLQKMTQLKQSSVRVVIKSVGSNNNSEELKCNIFI